MRPARIIFRRIAISLLIGLFLGAALSEVSFHFLKETARPPQKVLLTIPHGTAEQVARGDQSPSIPENMIFVVGDTLVVKNEDSVDHKLGTLWIPANSSAELPLGQEENLAYECTFQPGNYFGLDVREPLTLGTRVFGIIFAGLPMGVLIALYSFVFPAEKKRMFLVRMFSRRWLLTTLLVFAGTTLCVRLGIWQLDRLDGRRAENAHISAMWAIEALDLNSDNPPDIEKMEYRAVQVVGEYDFQNQVALRNRYFGDQPGYHLLTPLLFDGTAVLVDRGWIPAEGNSTPADWRKYEEPGSVKVSGQIRLGQTKPAFGGVADAIPENGARLEVWNNADITRIASQMPYPILPVFIQPEVDENDSEPPIPYQLPIELTEGSHFGYALQWFTFATILFAGYPFYLRKQETQTK